MLSDEVVKNLATMPQFQANCKALAGELHISLADAQQELLLELMEHRINDWDEQKLIIAIEEQAPELGWRIHYARKDVARRKHHQERAERELVDELGAEQGQSRQSVLPSPDVTRALCMAPSMFSNHQTQQWVQFLLTNGKRDTMLAFGQSDRQFSNKLRNVATYCNSHRDRSISYQRQEQAQHQAKELAILEGWNVLMADEDTTDTDIQVWIALHRRYVEPLVNKSGIRYQGLVMNAFCRAPNSDKYRFANLLAHQYQQLQRGNEK